MKLINFKLNSNKSKINSYINEIHENTLLKNKYYQNIVKDFNKKIDNSGPFMFTSKKSKSKKAVKCIDNSIFDNNQISKQTNSLLSKLTQTLHKNSFSDNNNTRTPNNDLTKYFESCFCYPMDNNITKPDSREGCS